MKKDKRTDGNPAWARPNHGTHGHYPSPFVGDSQRLKDDCKTFLPRNYKALPEDFDDYESGDYDNMIDSWKMENGLNYE